MSETTVKNPVGGVDYPRTWDEFEEWFQSEPQCVAYWERVRWPSGFVCPGCGATKGWPTARGQWRCAPCQRQTSATAGALFEGTHKPLKTWFRAMWYVTSSKQGVSALGLQKVLGLGSYETAWTWLHKLRRAMVRPGRDRLCREVEVDETYLGGTEAGVHGRQTCKKAVIAIAVEVQGRGMGRIRLARVPDVSTESLVPFIEMAVAPGAVVRTDGWGGVRRSARSRI